MRITDKNLIALLADDNVKAYCKSKSIELNDVQALTFLPDGLIKVSHKDNS